MRLLWLVALTSLVPFFLADTLSAQSPTKESQKLEQHVRMLDQQEAAAVLASDVTAIEKLWADDFTINAPNNQVLKGKKGAIQLVKDGILDYSSFKRDVEAVLVNGETVIVMGEETVKPKGKAPFAGQTVSRRFTNIWMKKVSGWRLTARQATLISIQPSTHTVAPLTADEESAVQAIVAKFASTWNRHDMKAMHELNTEDVEWVNVTANYWQGNPTVLKGHGAIHRTIFAKTNMAVEKTFVRAVAPNVAIAVAAMKFSPVPMPSGEVLSEMRTRGSFVMVRRDGLWRIVHFQNTAIDPNAETNDPSTWDERAFLPGTGQGTSVPATKPSVKPPKN